MIGPVLHRYGFELVQEPLRLRNLVEHQCQKQGQPLPAEEVWGPAQEGWLLGWPGRGSAAYLERYRQLRSRLIRNLGGNLEGWLDFLPSPTAMPTPRTEVEVGQGPGCQPNLAEGLARLGWGGHLVLDQHPQMLPPLVEGEIHISGGDQEKTLIEMGQARWPQGWLRLQDLELTGDLVVSGGLVELHRCCLRPGASLEVSGAGAILVLDESDIYGEVEAQAGTLLQASNCNFEGSAVGLESTGLVRLQGVAFSQHAQAALLLRERARAMLEDCQLRESGFGLRASGQARVWLSQSWLRGNAQCGLLADDDTDLEIQACHFRNNGGDGLWLRGRSRVQLRISFIQDNGTAGVRVSDQVSLEQAGNQATGNPQGDWLEARN
ncbi:right-handed parallel beta-helix repeat-containing protein [bacterium]|nr:right-handed parallel beta-helix repeat-containing protein [bacterium]